MAKRRHKHDGRSDLVKSDGALVMTFVNTGSRRSPRLRDYGDLLQWSVLHGALTASGARRLELLVADQPLQADIGFAAADRPPPPFPPYSSPIDNRRYPSCRSGFLLMLIENDGAQINEVAS